MKNYDIVIVGAGHAGCEAAFACAKMGCKTLMVTLDINNVGFMPCNPSIGGTAKGHLVCEIDALGGIMGIAADKTAIQIRLLNESKGPAVASLRAQIDKDAYHSEMLRTLQSLPHLDICEGEVTDILTAGKTVCTSEAINTSTAGKTVRAGEVINISAADKTVTGIKLAPKTKKANGTQVKDTQINCKCVIIATGVYLQSKTFAGSVVKNEGPSGFTNANLLTKSLINLGLEIRRFKTGTPARIVKSSINFDETEPQYGGENIRPFSFINNTPIKNTALCHLTYTNAKTHRIIRDNIKKSAMYSGLIVGIGPRYCPSIDDKVMRFPDRERHQTFLEPETLTGESIYLQGLSTSLPDDIQAQFIHSIKGLNSAKIIKSGYAIEYDCINSLQLLPTLQYKNCSGLYFAGQVNGTSGYEEAAAQGLLAGINSALYCKNTISCGNYVNNNTNQLILSRTNSYIGVLVDDLTTIGTNEPYRMFTARAEHRLFLRQDNADTRLTPVGREVGLVDDNRWKIYLHKQKLLQEARKKITDKTPKDIANIIAIENTYKGYLAREERIIKETKRQEAALIPAATDYSTIKSLRKEAQIKLNTVRPVSIGQASRISGVTPADITVLLIHFKKEAKTK
jgi:tRNA uridine 5-carboxymethylaminomethyl modification enzyme